MKVDRDQVCVVCTGSDKPNKFQFCLAHLPDYHQSRWLYEQFGGYGVGYYYSNGNLWFKRARDEAMFTLRWL